MRIMKNSWPIRISYKKITSLVALFLLLFTLSLTYGPWNGSDYAVYVNATICEKPLPNLCVVNDTQEPTSYLGTSPDDSVFTQHNDAPPSIQQFFEKLPATYYFRFLSLFSQPNVLLSLLTYNTIAAALATFLLGLTFLLTPPKRRSWLICTLGIIFMIPAYSQLTATPYPLALSSFALFFHLSISRHLISACSSKLNSVFLISAHVIAISLILTTRFEVAALLIADLAILVIGLIRNDQAERVTRGYFIILLLITTTAVLVIPTSQGLIQEAISGKFRLIPNGLILANPNYVAGSSNPSEQNFNEIDDSFTLSHGRITQVVAAPFIYSSELVGNPWLKNNSWIANLVRVLVFSGLALVVWWSRFWNKKYGSRRTILLLSLLLIALPSVSAHGSLRFQYTLPFVMLILWQFQTRRYNWVSPARYCVFLSLFINLILLFRFSNAFDSVDLYFLRLPSIYLPIINSSSIIFLIYSLRSYIFPVPEKA